MDTTFGSKKLNESRDHFRQRLDKVCATMNSDAFKAENGRGLEGLSKELHERCEQLITLKGERLPK